MPEYISEVHDDVNGSIVYADGVMIGATHQNDAGKFFFIMEDEDDFALPAMGPYNTMDEAEDDLIDQWEEQDKR